MKSGRIEEIDGLRGIAIALVVSFHYLTRWSPSSGEGLYPYGESFARWPIFRDGAVGVHLFFLVSGFVIFQSLGRSKSLVDFAIKRADRLWLPMMALSTVSFVLLSTLLVTPYFNAKVYDFLPSWTFTSPMLWKWANGEVDYIDGVYWTLFVEVRFYLLMALIWFSPLRASASVALSAFATVGLAAFLVLKLTGISSFGKIVELLMFPQYISLFAAGTVYSQIRQNGITAAYVAQLVLLIPLGLVGIKFGVLADSGYLATIVWVAFFHCIFLSVSLNLRWTRIFSYWLLVRLGAISYSLYLIHQRVGVAILHRLPEGWPSWMYLAAVVTTFGLMIVIAYLSWRFIEEQRPFSRFLRSWKAATAS